MDIYRQSNHLGQAILNAIVSYGEGDNNADVLSRLQEEIELAFTEPTNVKVYNIDNKYPLPEYSHEGDACMDLRASRIEFAEDNLVICYTGLYVALPKGYELIVKPRSGLTKTKWYIPNSPGTVDEPYRGEIQVRFRYADPNINIRDNKFYFPFREGERIAQMSIYRVEPIKWVEVNSIKELGETERGSGGHQSTGLK